MRRLGVLSSPGYRNQKGALARVKRLLVEEPQVAHREVQDPGDVADALRSFETDGIDVVAVNGGDGTLSMVVTDLLRRSSAGGCPEPLLAVLAGGRTNMSAGDFGMTGHPERQLKRLMAWAEHGHLNGSVVHRPVMSVDLGPGKDTLYGFFFGAAAIYDISQLCWDFRESTHMPGSKSGIATTVKVGSSVTRLLLGGKPFDPSHIRVRLDGEDLEEREFSALFLTTLDRMALGMRPFFDDRPAPIRFTAVSHRHHQLFRVALAAFRGRASRAATERNGYHGRNAHAVELEIATGGTLDGEVVTPVDGHPVRIRADREVRFIRP